MKTFEIELKDGPITIEVAANDDTRKEGLSGRGEIENGMLFVFPYTGRHQVWMKSTEQDLDILFINEKGIITQIAEGKAEDKTLLGDQKDTRYVLELPEGSAEENELEVGDILPIPVELSIAEDEQEAPQAFLLDADGNPQMDIYGGERVFSRPKSAEIIKLAKTADSDEALLALGKLVSDEIDAQNGREEEYVEPGKTRHQYAKDGTRIKEIITEEEEGDEEDTDTVTRLETMLKKLRDDREDHTLEDCIIVEVLFGEDLQVGEEKYKQIAKDLRLIYTKVDENSISAAEGIIEIRKAIEEFKDLEETVNGIPESAMVEYLEAKGYKFSKSK